MTVVAERFFVTAVKVEAPTTAALDEATKVLGDRLAAAVPGRLSGLRVLSKSTVRVSPRGESFARIT